MDYADIHRKSLEFPIAGKEHGGSWEGWNEWHGWQDNWLDQMIKEEVSEQKMKKPSHDAAH